MNKEPSNLYDELSQLDGLIGEFRENIEFNPNLIITDIDSLNTVNDFFSSITCGDKDIENLLYEVIGYSLTKTSKLSKAFIFFGKGRNGKSKVFRLIENILKSDQCSHEHLENLCGSKAGGKSSVNKLLGKCCNIAEDQKPVKYMNTSLITRIISGEPVGDSDTTPYCTMLFSVNEVIDFKETGLHITDRIVIIPFLNTFLDSNNNRKINIEDDLCQLNPLSIIATKALIAFNKVLENGHFSIPQVVIDETNKYFLECNNVAEFCGLYPIESIITKSSYYQEYRNWCNYNNREAVSNNVFGKEVLALGYRAERYSFKNDRKTYYAAPSFDNYNSQDVYNDYISSTGLSKESIEAYTDKELEANYNIIPFEDYLCNQLYSSATDN